MRSSIPSGYILSGVLNIRAFRPIHMPKYAKIIRKIHSQFSFPWKGASVTTGYAFIYQDMPVYQSITVKVPLTVPWHNSQLALNDPLLLTSHPLKKCRKWAKKEKEKRKKKKSSLERESEESSQSICWKLWPLFRGILTGWRNGLAGPRGAEQWKMGSSSPEEEYLMW